MPRTYGLKEYQDMAAKRDMEFLGPLPGFVKSVTRWRCLHCGTVHEKTYRALSLRERGCTCKLALQDDAYLQLATDHDLVWQPKGYSPANSKAPTTWKSIKTGLEFEASYSDIKWKRPNWLKVTMGLPISSRGGRRVKHAS